MTVAEKRHMGKVAALGCIACRLMGYGETPAQVHHIREGRIARDAFLTIPLCPEHHTGQSGIHLSGAMLLLRCKVSSEFDLLARVLRLIA